MTKVISISDEAYGELSRMKMNLSFSKIILELTKAKRKDNLSAFIGILDNKGAEKMKAEIRETRKMSSRRFK
jgi:predicted CopG family antitoxin